MKLLDGTGSLVVRDKMSEFAEDIACKQQLSAAEHRQDIYPPTSDFDQILVTRRRLEVFQALCRCVLLHIFVVNDDLDDPEPNLFAHVISRRTDQLQDCDSKRCQRRMASMSQHQSLTRVDIPRIFRCEFFGEDSDLKDELFAHGVVSHQ